MALSEGTTSFPNDASGAKAIGVYYNGNFYFLRGDDAKNLKVGLYDPVGNPLVWLPDTTYNAATQLGQMPMAVRKDTAAALATADGHLQPLEVNNLGELRTAAPTGGVAVNADPAFGTLASGKLNAAGSSTPFPTLTCRKVRVKARTGNTAALWIAYGAAAVDACYPLAPGESVDLAVTNLNVLHYISENGTETGYYLAFVS